MAARHRISPEERKQLLADWQASGLSASEFAPRAGVTVHTLYTWRRRARAGAGDAAAGRFAELVVRHSSEASAPAGHAGEPDGRIEIAVGEAIVRVGAVFEDAHLRRVLDVVRAMA